MPRVLARCAEFIRLGVSEVWIFDPASRRAFRLRSETLTEATDPVLSLPGTAIQLDLPRLFAVLDL